MTTKLHPYTIKDTGITIAIRKVNPNLINEFQKNFNEKTPTPAVPTQIINYGDALHPDLREEKNESHPDYKKALAERNSVFGNLFQNFLIRRGVVYELTEADKTAVAQLREDWREDTGAELGTDDKEVFIRYIAVGTPEDLKELSQMISRRTQPTEVAVEENLKSI